MPAFPKTTGRQVWCVWFIVCVGLLAKSLIMGTLGDIGADSDDIMRLVQVRDLYAGQSWFDLMQYRMGAGGGTLMHWSRLVDAPLLALIWLFDLFIPYARAEQLAIIIWPPLSAIFVIWGVMVGMRHLGGGKAAVFGVVLLLFLLLPHYRFSPGAIDHHNVQLGLLALALGYALDRATQARSFAITGMALAISVAIGPEVIIFVAVLCLFTALNWCWNGETARRGAMAFGAGFAATLTVIFFATVAPENYGVIACDGFSFTMVTAGVPAGLGLASLAWFMSARPLIWRTSALGLLGVVCLCLLMGQAPQCLANPLDSLPPEAKTLWLDHVVEAQPLFADRSKWISLVPYAVGPAVLAAIIAVMNIWRGRRASINALLAALLITAIGLSLYQVRFQVFGGVFAIFVLAPWIGKTYERTRTVSDKNVSYVFALAASIPFVWGFPGLMMTPVNKDITKAQGQALACYSDAVMSEVANLPTGFFAITPNGAAPLLQKTSHNVLGGNYHRNADGIVANIHVFTLLPNEAGELLRDLGVTYVHVCRATEESRVFAKHSPEGLMAQLIDGDVPEFLIPVSEGLEGGNVSLYRVKAP